LRNQLKEWKCSKRGLDEPEANHFDGLGFALPVGGFILAMRIPARMASSAYTQGFSRLSRYGYYITRQTGSHLRLTSTL
jgi:hypothetical protein